MNPYSIRWVFAVFLLLAAGILPAGPVNAGLPQLASGSASVEGIVSIPQPSDFGMAIDLQSLQVRVEGTDISAPVEELGSYLLDAVPLGANTLVIEEAAGMDVFTTQSRRLTVNVPVGGLQDADFSLEWKWTLVPLPALYPARIGYRAAFFAPPNNGWLLVDYYDSTFEIKTRLFSTSTGTNWSEVYSWFKPNLPGIAMDFISGAHNWISGDPLVNRGGVSMTPDGNSRYWHSLPDAYDMGSNFKNAFATQIAAFGDNQILAAGYEIDQEDNRSDDVLWESTDNGVNWNVVLKDLPNVTALGTAPDGMAVAFLNKDTTCKPIRRDPATGTWFFPEVNTTWCISGTRRIAYEENHFIATADSGTPGVFVSEDGGETWARYASTDPGAVDFSSAGKGWAAASGDIQTLRVTYDGGHTWLTQVSTILLPVDITSGEGVDVFALSSLLAYWRTGHEAQPLVVHHNPEVVDMEVAQAALRSGNGILARGQVNNPLMSLEFINHGTQLASNIQINLHRSGAGAGDLIDTITAFWDRNRNGVYDESDTLLANVPYPADSTPVSIPLTAVEVGEGQAEMVGIAVNTRPVFDVYDGLSYGLSFQPAVDVSFDSGALVGQKATAPADMAFTAELDNLDLAYNEPFTGLDRWMVGGNWIITSSYKVTPPSSVIIEPYEGDGTTRSMMQKYSVVLPYSNTIQLAFWNRHNLFNNGDNVFAGGYVDVSTDGQNWERLKSFLPPAGGQLLQKSWYEELFDLSAYAGQRAILRFTYEQGIPGTLPRFWNIDDVRFAFDRGSAHFIYLPVLQK